jgi:hypothetical protein
MNEIILEFEDFLANFQLRYLIQIPSLTQAKSTTNFLISIPTNVTRNKLKAWTLSRSYLQQLANAIPCPCPASHAKKN